MDGHRGDLPVHLLLGGDPAAGKGTGAVAGGWLVLAAALPRRHVPAARPLYQCQCALPALHRVCGLDPGARLKSGCASGRAGVSRGGAAPGHLPDVRQVSAGSADRLRPMTVV